MVTARRDLAIRRKRDRQNGHWPAVLVWRRLMWPPRDQGRNQRTRLAAIQLRSIRNPRPKQLDLGRRQCLFLLRHPILFIRRRDAPKQLALVWFTGNHRLVLALPGLHERFEGMDSVSPLRLLRAM